MKNWHRFFLRLTICLSMLGGLLLAFWFYDVYSDWHSPAPAGLVMTGFGLGAGAVCILYFALRWIVRGLNK